MSNSLSLHWLPPKEAVNGGYAHVHLCLHVRIYIHVCTYTSYMDIILYVPCIYKARNYMYFNQEPIYVNNDDIEDSELKAKLDKAEARAAKVDRLHTPVH